MGDHEERRREENRDDYVPTQHWARSNGIGVAGFVFAILSVIFCWVNVIGWIFWILGVILSFVGCFKVPRALAIAGLFICFIGLMLLLFAVGGEEAVAGVPPY